MQQVFPAWNDMLPCHDTPGPKSTGVEKAIIARALASDTALRSPPRIHPLEKKPRTPLWLAQTLKVATDARSEGLDRSIRINLADWGGQLSRPVRLPPMRHAVPILSF